MPSPSFFSFLDKALAAPLSEPMRLFLWLPVALGCGITLYAGSDFSPRAAALLTLVALTGLFWAHRRNHSGALLLSAGLLAVMIGFGLMALRTHLLSTPVIEREWKFVTISGTIEEILGRARGASVILKLEEMQPTPEILPQRVQISLRTLPPTPLHPQDRLTLRATLAPPGDPLMPGGYDFRRHAFFKEIGAYGYALGAPKNHAPTTAAPANLEAARESIAAAIRARLDGDTAAVAIALLTGEQTAISEARMEEMRNAGIVHILSISGLHIAIVAGMSFFLLRLLLALIPGAALRWPIKKIAAIAALLATLGYTLLVGAPVPTIRAAIMTGLVFLAIMLDRRAITLRLVAIAALVVLVFWPEALFGPSFQLSFAAVTALIAFYEVTQRRWPPAENLLLKAGAYVLGIIITTLIATLATAPFTIFHFQQLPVYGALANLLALPLTSFVIMPLAMLSYAVLHTDAAPPVLDALGWGIGQMLDIAAFVSALPGAALQPPPLPGWGLGLIIAGGLWLCLWQRAPRFWGLVPIALGALSLLTFSPPDLVVSPNGKHLALRLPDGSYAWRGGNKKFLKEQWAGRLGVTLFVSWKEAQKNFPDSLRCDKTGCLWFAHDQIIALPLSLEAMREDCALADAVVAFFYLRPSCGTWQINRNMLSAGGTHAVWLKEGKIKTALDGLAARAWRAHSFSPH